MTELCVCARVHLGPRGDARRNRPPMGGVGRGPPGPEGLSSQRKPLGRVEPSWGSRNQSRLSRLCPPPRPGPHGGLDRDLYQASSARTHPGSLLWTGVVGTGSGPYWPPFRLAAGPHDHGQEPQEAPEGAGTWPRPQCAGASGRVP